MALKSALQATGWMVAGVLGGYLLFERLHQPAREAPIVSPVPAATMEPAPVTPIATQPPSTLAEAMARAFPASTSPTPPQEVLAPRAPVTSGAPSPTPDPHAEMERQYRAQPSFAKSKAESLEAAAKQECPDLKPGDLRLPEAVNQCTRLRAEATQAATEYENLKKEALRMGIWLDR
jgi:hypothetical protein